MSAPGRPNLSRVLPLMGGALATRRRKGYQGRSPWLVGTLDRALERGLEGLKPHEQYLLGLARDKAIAAAIGQICGACQWEVRS
jgi:hypothetical protein